MSANPAPDEDQPRTLERPCSQCGHVREVLNGAHYRRLREKAKVTLTQMARLCDLGSAHLSHMERGSLSFLPKYAVLYHRLLDRRRRSGDE